MPSWLNQHRKSELAELAGQAGIEDISELRKDQIVALLEEQLTNNASHLSQIPAFDEYYARRGSPLKREAGSTPLETNGDVPKSVSRRRVSRIKGESDADPVSSPTAATTRRAAAAVVAHTPARIVEETSLLSPPRMPLPPSPAVVTDVIEEQTARISEGVNRLWTASHIMDALYQARVELSSVTGIQITILLIESISLHRATVPWKYVLDVPSLFGLPSFPIFLPDLFVFLTHYYWAPSLLWATMNFWLPLATGWLFNLSLRLKKKEGLETWRPKYRIDPLTFSIAKALSSWLVYSQGNRVFGAFADETVKTVESAMPYGYSGAMVAAYVGIATSVWDGIQGKKGWQ